MFDPEWEDGCPSCTAGTDELSAGFFAHLHTRDTSYAMVSRAPLAKLERWKAKKGRDVPWCSSFGTEFNYDFGVTIDESVAPGEDNFRTKAEFEAMGSDFFGSAQPFEMPGRSCFLQVGGRVFHTCSQYARPGVHRRLLLLPRPHRARPARGVGGTQGTQRVRKVRHARLRVVTTHLASLRGRSRSCACCRQVARADLPLSATDDWVHGRRAHAAEAAEPVGASLSHTNSSIPISRSASRSYRGYAGRAVARSMSIGPATVWSAPR
jgi:hypothetical protein